MNRKTKFRRLSYIINSSNYLNININIKKSINHSIRILELMNHEKNNINAKFIRKYFINLFFSELIHQIYYIFK